jgi:ATP-dependent Clp endopeptidase proteolytic subunit ClpP
LQAAKKSEDQLEIDKLKAELKAAKLDAELSKLNMTFDKGLDLDNRIIYIFDDIDEGVAETVIMSLSHLSLTEGKITIMINSEGGSVPDMFAIYDAIRACPNDITTIGIGEVCSAAGLLFVAGDKRLASKNCLFMAHQVIGGYNTDENLNTAEAQIAATRMCWDRWAKCMAEHTNKNIDYWKRQMPTKLSELWLSPEEMILPKYGIADGIWE